MTIALLKQALQAMEHARDWLYDNRWAQTDCANAIEAIRSHLTSPVPDDWVLVPRVPTQSMVAAGFTVDMSPTIHHACGDIYRAMIAVAPPAPKAASPVPEFEYVGVVAKSTMCVTVAWAKELPHNAKLYVVPDSKVEVNSTPNTCQWTPMDEDYMPGSYDTSCGVSWSFVEGDIAENGVKFCHGCGKPVVEVTLKDNDD